MMSSLDLKNQMLAYVYGEISLDDLRSWIAAHLSSLILDPYSQEADLVAAIEGILAEAEIDELTNDEIREEIKKIVPDMVFIQIPEGVPQDLSFSSNDFCYQTPEILWVENLALSVAENTFVSVP